MSLDILRDNQADTDEIRLVQKNPDNTDRQRKSALSIVFAGFPVRGLIYENCALFFSENVPLLKIGEISTQSE